MIRFLILAPIVGIIVPAFLFGRAGAVVRGFVIGIALWATSFVLWVIADLMHWIQPSTSLLVSVCLIVFMLDFAILGILASLVVSKPDKVAVAEVAVQMYADLPPEAKAATRRIASGFLGRMAARRKPGVITDVLAEAAKGLSQ